MAPSLPSYPAIVAAAVYRDAPGEEVSPSTRTAADVSIPVLHHLAGKTPAAPVRTSTSNKQYLYPQAASHKFATPFHADFLYHAESVSHTRNLTLLKDKMGGPHFDLEGIWDEHCHYEFADRSVEHTMSTMVQEPYVNHVPTVRFFCGGPLFPDGHTTRAEPATSR